MSSESCDKISLAASTGELTLEAKSEIWNATHHRAPGGAGRRDEGPRLSCYCRRWGEVVSFREVRCSHLGAYPQVWTWNKRISSGWLRSGQRKELSTHRGPQQPP